MEFFRKFRIIVSWFWISRTMKQSSETYFINFHEEMSDEPMGHSFYHIDDVKTFSRI